MFFSHSFIAILILSALIGLFLLWIITKKMNVIIFGIQQFRLGNLKSRIPVKSNDDLDNISLAIVKKIIDLHDSTIHVESIKGKGT